MRILKGSIFCFLIWISAGCFGNSRGCPGKLNQEVCITFVNKTSLTIDSIQIIKNNLDTTIGLLPGGKTESTKLTCQGEDSYILIVHFNNGDSVRTTGNYIEPGYRITENVYLDKITTVYRSVY